MTEPSANEQSGRRRTSVADLATVAKSGYLLARGSANHIDFEVHHIHDNAGYLLRMLSSEDQGPRFSGLFTSAANGVGVLIGTRTVAATSRLIEDRTGRRTTKADIARSGERNIIRGTARPNPSAVSDTVQAFEAIICIDAPDNPNRSFRRAVAVKKLVEFAATVAAEENAPLLFGQWPEQVPAKDRGAHDVRHRTEGIPPHASSPAFRFSFALARGSAAERIRIGDRLKEYANMHGFGLWLSDIRDGYRPGSWFQVCTLRRERDEIPDDDVELCLPVTFVGPARPGSTRAIMRLLGSLTSVGVVGFSKVTLDDLSFVHLRLCFRNFAMNVYDASSLLTARDDTDGDPASVIADVMRRLGLAEALTADGTEIASKAYDYKTLVGTMFPFVLHSGRRMAIWFSWRIANRDGALLDVMSGLYRALERLGLAQLQEGKLASNDAPPNIEYLLWRRTRGSVLTGKGKISILKTIVDERFNEDRLETPASRLSELLESAWRVEMLKKSGFLELNLGWRESWLRNSPAARS